MSKRDADMNEELEAHVQRLTEQKRASGLPPEQARRAALIAFGSIEGLQQSVRAQRRFAWLGDVGRDVVFGARLLRKSPGFTALIVLTLALGIGAAAAIFSVVDRVLLHPLPIPEPDRVVVIREVLPGRSQEVLMTSGKYLDWAAQARSFESWGGTTGVTFNATGTGDPVLLYGARITASLLTTLGIQPLLGRNFLPEEQAESDKETVAILSHQLWQRRFAGRRDVLGQPLQLNGRRLVIVGVLPPDSGLPEHDEIFTPLAFSANARQNYANPFVRVVARLRPGVTMAQAQAELTILAGRTALAHPVATGWGVRVIPVVEATVGDLKRSLLALLGAVGLLLLIACANVANLLLARASSRGKEMAVRAAMGASRGRIIRQLLIESLLLSLLGGALGVGLAHGGLALLLELPPDTLPRASSIAIDGRALGFAFVLVVLTGTGFGLAPAFQAARVNLGETLKQSARGTSPAGPAQRLRQILVAGELAMALVLLAGAGLLIRSFSHLLSVNPGFNPDGAHIGTVLLPLSQYNTRAQHAAFAQQAIEGLSSIPGVVAATVTTNIPFSGAAENVNLNVEGQPRELNAALTTSTRHRIGGDYFRAMQIPLLRGRGFGKGDTTLSAKVVIISQSLARGLFADQEPLGRRIELGGPNPAEIVGIAGDVMPHHLDGHAKFQTYEPFAQNPTRSFTYVVRSAEGSQDRLLPAAIGKAIRDVDPAQPIEGIRPLAHLISDSIARQRFAMTLLSLFSATALLLAALGMYGVMAHAVAQRTNEIGVRMALGARAGSVLRLVLNDGARLVAVGVAAGLVGALLLTRVLGAMLFGVGAQDPVTFAGMTLILITVAALACLIPAVRATKVDPMTALRAE